jgi:hypothetical protein
MQHQVVLTAPVLLNGPQGRLDLLFRVGPQTNTMQQPTYPQTKRFLDPQTKRFLGTLSFSETRRFFTM